MESFCQKMTERISTLLSYTKKFDSLAIDRKNKPELLEMKKGIIDKLNSILSDYQEHLWPPEKFPRITIQVGGDTPEELRVKLENKINISPTTKVLFEKVFESKEFKRYSNTTTELNFILVNACDEIDLINKITAVKSIFSRNKRLKMVPLFSVPYIALYYSQGSQKKSYFIATEFMPSQAGTTTLFQLHYPNEKQPWISSPEMTPDSNLLTSQELIFMLPQIVG